MALHAKLCGLLICLLVSLGLGAQTREVVVKGCVMDEAGRPVKESYIKISSNSSSALLAFINTGDSSCFSLPVAIPVAADSLSLTVSNTHYETLRRTLACPSTDSAYEMTLVLPTRSKTLENVTVRPSIWKRGDTTFFNVEQLKFGDERKLIDILQRLPGFSFDQQGNLLFNRKRVEKAMIDGQELFADKLALLINSFPIHVIEQIQAIENQSSDPMLKGLTSENKVFLNLSIKKSKIRAAFGDGELGVGTRERYQFSPILFSLYGRLKVGLIGDFNSTGTGVDEVARQEFRFRRENLVAPLGPREPMPGIIPFIAGSRYVRNQKKSAAVQVNQALSKRVQMKTEAGFWLDRQRQRVFGQMLLLGDSTIFARNDSSRMEAKPILTYLKNKMDVQLSSTRHLQSIVQLYYEDSRGIANNSFTQDAVASRVSEQVQNRTMGGSIQLDYVHRKTENVAKKINFQLAGSRLRSTGEGYSAQYPAIFRLPDSTYSLLYLQPVQQQMAGQLSWSLLRKSFAKFRLHSLTFLSAYQAFSLRQHSVFGSTHANLPIEHSELFNRSGKYQSARLQVQAGFSLDVWRGMAPLQVTTQGAVVAFKRKELLPAQEQLMLELKGGLRQTIFNSRRGRANATFEYNQQAPDLDRLPLLIRFSSLRSIAANASSVEPIRSVRMGGDYTYTRSSLTSSFFVSFTRNISGYIQLPGYVNFLLVSTDTLIQRPGNLFYLGNWTTFYSNGLGSIVSAYVNYSVSSRLIPVGSDLLYTRNKEWLTGIDLSKNVRDRWQMKWQLETRNYRARLPRQLKEQALRSVWNAFSNLQFKYMAGPFHLQATLENYWTDFTRPSSTSIYFLDVEGTWKKAKSPWSLRVQFNNILNAQYFTQFMNSPLVQEFSSIPLVGRNVFLALRYEL